MFLFKSCQVEQRNLFLLLLEDPGSFRADLFALTVGNGVEDMALFMHHTALPGSRSKEGRDSSQESLMSIRHHQIYLGGATAAQVL